MSQPSPAAQRRKLLEATYQPREEWWSRVFASPVAHWLLCLVADWKTITPNRLTVASFLLVLIVAALILTGSPAEIRLAAILLQVAYIFDCMDGQLARYRKQTSDLGAFLDKSLDFLKIAFLVFALSMEAFHRSQSETPLILGFLCFLLTCFLPYLKLLAKADFDIGPREILLGRNFWQRNIRFFLFEEAQWYFTITICLLFLRADWALWILCLGLGPQALLEMVRIVGLLRNPGIDNSENSHF
ncbi:MAG: hypothetical protein COB53_05915 [Elusimicrobia bacterium]|nr:MAG: hypothetical protein COB53_05915 [Elusimicrobiota bacterium]